MSGNRSGKSHATASGVVIFAASMLYLLTVPLVINKVYLSALPSDNHDSWSSEPIPPPPLPEWLDTYSQPYYWLSAHTILKKPMQAYSDWFLSER